MHEEKDLFLGVNCQPILAHPVTLLPLAQLERSYCFLAYNSKGTGRGPGEGLQEQLFSEWKQDDFCSKQFPQHPPFPPTMDPTLKGCQGHVEVTEHQHMQDMFSTLKGQQEEGRANQLTLPDPTQVESSIFYSQFPGSQRDESTFSYVKICTERM